MNSFNKTLIGLTFGAILGLGVMAVAQTQPSTGIGGGPQPRYYNPLANGVSINSNGADSDSTIACDTNANCFKVDAGSFGGVGAVGIGVAPAATAIATLEVSRPATTAIANTDYYTAWIDNDAAITIPTGTASLVATLLLEEPNITATGTCSTSATLKILDAATECGNNYALLVAAGTSFFGGNVQLTSSVSTSSTFTNTGKMVTTGSTLSPAAAATTLAVTRNFHAVDCDGGGNTIGTITGGVDGMCVDFRFVDASCTITDTDDGGSNTVDLNEVDAVAGTIVSADDLMLRLCHDGTSWRQTSPMSAN